MLYSVALCKIYMRRVHAPEPAISLGCGRSPRTGNTTQSCRSPSSIFSSGLSALSMARSTFTSPHRSRRQQAKDKFKRLVGRWTFRRTLIETLYITTKYCLVTISTHTHIFACTYTHVDNCPAHKPAVDGTPQRWTGLGASKIHIQACLSPSEN